MTTAAPPGSLAALTEPPLMADARNTLRREAVNGATTMVPLLVGYLPFALTIGVAARGSEEPLAAWTGALLIFGGSAHLSVIELLGHGSSVVAAVATGLLINSRVAVYSASLASLWRGARLRHRLLAAAVVIDPMWLIAERRQAQPGSIPQRRAFYAGAGAALALGWSAMIAAGMILGAPQEATSYLAVFTPLCLSAIIAPHLRTPGGMRCVAAAGVVAAVTASWPSGTGLLAAMAAGAAAGGPWRMQVRR